MSDEGTAAAKRALDDANDNHTVAKGEVSKVLAQIQARLKERKDVSELKQQASQWADAAHAANRTVLRKFELYLQAQLRQMEARRLTLRQTWARHAVPRAESDAIDNAITNKRQEISNAASRRSNVAPRARLPWETR